MKLSLKASMLTLFAPIVLGGGVVSWTTWVSLTHGVHERQVANHVNELAQHSRIYVAEMGSALKGYLLDPSNASEAEAKKQADEKNSKVIAEMQAIATSTETLKLIRELGEFDEKNLNPAEDAVLGLVKEKRLEEARAYFEQKYLPLRALYNELSVALADRASREARAGADGGDLEGQLRRSAVQIIVVLWSSLLLAAAALIWRVFGLSRNLSQIIGSLEARSSTVLSASADIKESSGELSSVANQQAAAIQQTAASVDQVSATIKKSAENASQSQKVSQEARTSAEQGQRAASEMAQAIAEIVESNASVMTQVEDGNRRISEIVKVIAEIGSKTKVINDIVFQTKLLSFNASVEAARAGEHGKGFAVVAEEVGNLAEMSGNAAKDISTLLEGSIQKVEGIVNETQSRVERFIAEGRGKVENGTLIAKKCDDTIRAVLKSVQEVDGMVAEIAEAAQEQAQGVSEINKAINELDQTMQKNTRVSEQAATNAEQLSGESQSLKSLVAELLIVIHGSPASSSPGVEPAPAKVDDEQGIKTAA